VVTALGVAAALIARPGPAQHALAAAHHVAAPTSATSAAARPAAARPAAAHPAAPLAHTGSGANPAARTHGARTSHAVVIAGPHGGSVAVTPDPEEGKSFPAPAGVQHSSAAAPASAGEAIVAPGAASTAEVRRELGQMHAAEQSARRQASVPIATVPGGDSVGGNGAIPIPQNVPLTVQRVIAGANAIADFPYVFGGGHASFVDNAYDCSGSVSYALAAGGLIASPETSGALESWGAAGPGKWITVYANAGHTYMYVNVGSGWMRFDTVGRSGEFASRWQPQIRSNEGFVARHPPGL